MSPLATHTPEPRTTAAAPPGPARRDLLDLETLPTPELVRLLAGAAAFRRVLATPSRKKPVLAGVALANVFFEPSTRTRVSFEWAAKRVGADSVSFVSQGSSVGKGESLLDTVWTLESMGVDLVVVRHQSAGVPRFLAGHLSARVINAGDGAHEHPTQGLLDARTLLDHWESLAGRRITIVGDIAHSRVARSNAMLLTALGAHVRFAGPRTLLPPVDNAYRVATFDRVEPALEGADVVMALRIQQERLSGALLPSLREYARLFGISAARLALAKPDAIVMHPGPINRGVELDGALADGPRSVILDQVEAGVAVRMAVLYLLSAEPGQTPLA